MATTYQVKKKAIGGYTVGYECPHCSSALTSSLEEAGTSQACPTCNTPFVVPGKAERDQLRAKQEQAQREKELQQSQMQKEKELQAKERARQRELEAEIARKQAVKQDALEDARKGYNETHCPYCYEEIKRGVKKCKNCHEYLGPEGATTQATSIGIVGTLLAIGGLCIALYFLFAYDTTTSSPSISVSFQSSGGERVHNLGLLQDRMLGSIAGMIMMAVGTIMTVIDQKSVVLGTDILATGTQVAPTFGRLCDVIRLGLDRPNVGAAEPCEVTYANLWRKRTDNRPWGARHGLEFFAADSRCYPAT